MGVRRQFRLWQGGCLRANLRCWRCLRLAFTASSSTKLASLRLPSESIAPGHRRKAEDKQSASLPHPFEEEQAQLWRDSQDCSLSGKCPPAEVCAPCSFGACSSRSRCKYCEQFQ